MQTQRASELVKIFSEVLGNLAFMMTEEQASLPPEDEPWLETRIGYRGAVRGDLTLRCPLGFARLLAANLLGLEPQSAEALSQAEDAAGEFMNIVCGQFVTARHGTGVVADLTIPSTQWLGHPREQDCRDEAEAAAFFVEGYCVEIGCEVLHEDAAA